MLLDHPPTDHGIATALLDMGGQNRLQFKKGIGWLTWEPDLFSWFSNRPNLLLGEWGELFRKEKAVISANKLQNWNSANNILRQLQALPRFTETKWNHNPDLVGMGGSVFDIRKLTVRRQDAKDYISINIPTLYNPDAKSPRFDKFLEEVQPNKEIRDYLQKLLGTGILPRTADQTFHFWYGDGSNGKGILGNVIADVLGPMCDTISSDVFMRHGDESATRFALSRLQECRLLFASEVDKGSSLGENRVKQLSGEEPVVVEEKGKTQESVVFNATLIMRVNDIPKISDSSYAMMRRIRVVPFSQQFNPQQNQNLQRQLSTEKEGILLWLIEGAHKYLTEGLGYPESIENATREAVKASFECADFLQECLVITKIDKDRIELKEFKVAYMNWCKENGQNGFITSQKMTEALKNFLVKPVIIHPGNVTTYSGVRLRSDAIVPTGLDIEI